MVPEPVRAYIDSDVLIWHLRGESRALRFLREISGSPGTEIWTGAMQRAEILFGLFDVELAATMSLLSRVKTAPVTREIVDSAGVLYRQWHPSHGIDPNDALLAATVAHTGGRLFTQNVKHFPMREIVVTKAW